MGNEDVVTAFHVWEDLVKVSISNSDEYKALCNESISDYDYKEKLSIIVQEYLYYALPAKFKTMTDEEYRDQLRGGGSESQKSFLMSRESWVSDWLKSLESKF